ncbi:succinate dehydrogenase, cytochrome b556 subunit [Dechloromonas denitrificans]|uniref:succinate dehydrogenase, cytochrome b556 subunit n=1 Tax=Azonexaceae TaxID=2008795 RepID=UPI001CF8092C|nr:succinate dehydrogenase, cytochrome b556 subunit [Dechloromonas denitrificans]UCV04879.1 succinate dehydrogenase, cytochrome b556 subunit [Dechloromonas denitrificans]UCV09261.1 succinate dehydrogenase, cytochrome b556 subunit [Dechloromonas denitrificans]
MAEMTIKKRPKNLDLTTIRLPLAGKVSILHRVSGAGLFLFLPVMLWLFSASLTSAETFATFKSVFSTLPAKVVMAGLIWAFVHHFCAGIRFLLLDLHVGIEKEAAAKSAGIVLAVSIPLTLVLWGVLL